jgi:hypothetical protein
MRKHMTRELRRSAGSELPWLDVETVAEVQLTSEDAAHPIESALRPAAGGWRAAEPGDQTIRFIFDRPQRIRRIWLNFVESTTQRTHEYVLRWSSNRGESFREIVRQQWNFSPPDSTQEIENYSVDLDGVTTLELQITPDIGGRATCASLAEMRLA